MALPTLTPKSNSSVSVLPVTGTHSNVLGALATGAYKTDEFVSGAVSQVTYVYRKLGGDVLDLEIKEENVYAAYEEACLEYSYLVNIHQSKNILSDVLGNTTASFDHKGEMQAGPLSSSLNGTHVQLKFPSFNFAYAKRVADGISEEANIGGNLTVHSASFDVVDGQQDYNLQTIVSAIPEHSASVGKKKVVIKKVYYKTPNAMWRYYGYYGGIGVVGNLSTYGQYADDTTFEVVPPWQNKLQAMNYEDSRYTRLSHYAYELKNNKLRLFPAPRTSVATKIWFEFSIPGDSWELDEGLDTGIDGINNMNTLPFDNVPYININSIGKQWIRRFALSLCKETLGHVRGKFGTIPIPGESVTLNGADLISQAQNEQTALREELKAVLDEQTYGRMMAGDAELVENAGNIQAKVPMKIFVG
tara:strand:- start:75971 stop:77221 length:1251 start_codon:yes stop_codon:yes gene_type:complete